MNKSILTSAMFAVLISSGTVTAETVVFQPKPEEGAGSGTGEGTGTTGTTDDETTFVLAEDVAETVIKNDKVSVSGEVPNSSSIIDPGIFKLVSSPVGIYGILEFNSGGGFTYRLNNDSPAVQALSETGVAADVFTYKKIASRDGRESQATITITVLSSSAAKQGAELVMTVIKNEKPEISGNLASGLGLTALSVKLLDSPAGKYGHLDFTSDGSFIYKIINDSPQVQALGVNDAAQEIFNYQVVDSEGGVTDAQLVVNILGNPSVSFDNVEIEINNSSAQATPLNSGQYIRGQLMTSSDKDWFVINSLGNEIIHMELCPEGSQCFDEKAWVLYVFDADQVEQQAIDDKTYPLTLRRDDTQAVLFSFDSAHMYLLLNRGIFDGSLVGIIDPCYGDTNTVDIGVGAEARNYLVAISSPLLRDGGEGCSDGSVVLERPGPSFEEPDPADPTKTKTITTTEEYTVAFPYSDDQYTIKATRTGVNPLAVMSPDSTTFDAAGRLVSIPKIRVFDQLYTAELQQLSPQGDPDASANFEIISLQPLDEALSASSDQAVYDSAKGVVNIPQVIDLQSGVAYSVELQYQPEDNTLQLRKAIPVQ